MNTTFKINGDVVTQEEWEGLHKDLPTSVKTQLELKNDTLTRAELDSILDNNSDGQISFEDFKDWYPNRFDRVAQILSRHGFNLAEKLLDETQGLKDFPEQFWSSKEFALAAVKENGWAFEYVDPTLQADREIFLTVVKDKGWLYAYSHTSLQKNPAFMTQLVQVNIGMLEALDPSLQNIVWQNIVKIHGWTDLLPKESLSNYATWKRALRDHYGILFIQRFHSLEVLHSIITLRHNPNALSSKPIAVIDYPRIDNHAFEQYPLMDRLTELGYQVFYYEAGVESQINRHLSEATQNGKNKADLII
ncbi:MAG: hypothetical protein A3F82_01085 [Deltaproteobacteria bacterium RIFCSPLOWO2_12_FULL_44_12]|nr:MAG: hypothetical protein A2712_03870 [Deltaproteobacteria bacterium RIFCSPHIGHO2_01_FULL_43_49]OGQ16324.1 MAG: hypothetical protein A3D22_01840 [Deltaproteobacteria bacterium RIFCSPHIGHO2_02_FULL_44_53]OGQ29284.1 MAG: hypothetical protein A3D98_05625 [Deltaproteobacteria bacterium RIFCSPHIGHO2_12_FULL_44_21]OGQ32841.1 MAG: hypothetical protein A2979_09770 [Deltaproteobacteria bacterium RIFCSPLOWO2_01_FULL_45_74]OGQ41942.1 MAG: hypothetical protein A3I70_09555 [Deltaproteobacteria bacterium 